MIGLAWIDVYAEDVLVLRGKECLLFFRNGIIEVADHYLKRPAVI